MHSFTPGKVPTEVFDRLSNRKKRKLFAPAQFPYYCEPCQKGFLSQEKLDDHLAQHLRCPYEGCQFVCKNAPEKLELHIRVHHTDPQRPEVAEQTEAYLTRRRRRFPTASAVEAEMERCLLEWHSACFSSPPPSEGNGGGEEEESHSHPNAAATASSSSSSSFWSLRREGEGKDAPANEKEVLSNGQKRWLFYHLQTEAHRHVLDKIPAEAGAKMLEALRIFSSRPILSDSDEEEDRHPTGSIRDRPKGGEKEEEARRRGRNPSTHTMTHRREGGGRREAWKERRREREEGAAAQDTSGNFYPSTPPPEAVRGMENRAMTTNTHPRPPPPPPRSRAHDGAEWTRKRERSVETNDHRRDQDDHRSTRNRIPPNDSHPHPRSGTDSRPWARSTPPRREAAPPSSFLPKKTEAPASSPPVLPASSSSSSSSSGMSNVPSAPPLYTAETCLDPSATPNHISKELVDALWKRACACHDDELISIVKKLKETP